MLSGVHAAVVTAAVVGAAVVPVAAVVTEAAVVTGADAHEVAQTLLQQIPDSHKPIFWSCKYVSD